MLNIITYPVVAPITVWLTVSLLALLVLKELISAAELQNRWKAFNHVLNIIIAPLLVIFCFIVAARIIAIL